jgi:uncharacterized protein YgbK (DUF1537 family)
MRCLLIADDLTGACDSAAQFRRRGARTVVEISADSHTCEVLAISTDSRGLAGSVAEARIKVIAERARAWAPEVIFKKVDSLWRGDQAGEIQACKAAFGCAETIVTPAFPALGRRVANGRLLVDVLADWPPLEIEALDASTDEDLRRIVRKGMASEKRILWAGSAGLAAALAHEMYPANVVFCIGSDHEVTATQEAELLARRKTGFRIVKVPWNSMSEGELRRALAARPFSALLMTGGETAALVCRAIGAKAIHLDGEIVTGLPSGRIAGGLYNGTPVATKSGAFGDPDAFLRVLDFFS